MSIIDKAENKIKEWVLGIAIKKGVISAAKILVSWCIAHGIKIATSINGIEIDTTNEATMIVVINSGLTMLRNYLKVKFPKTCGWI